MVEVWYGIVVLMLTLYVVLDGFDLGAAALHFAEDVGGCGAAVDCFLFLARW